jgi:hypothetical protein
MSFRHRFTLFLLPFLVCFFCSAVFASTVKISSIQELRAALAQAAPGVTIKISPGSYTKGISLKNVHGTAENPVVIMGECSYIKLSHLVFEGFSQNGVNIDDGGRVATPSHHIVLENITIREVGPKGNVDALKMSGVNHFIVRDCQFEGWGGSAIDLVGCHNGLIEGCRFVGTEGFRNANGVQIKGGSRYILVQSSHFLNAGERAVNLGGSTGLKYFRPAVMGFEAKDIRIAGNYFSGGEAHIAWVTSLDSYVYRNLFYLPEKWVGRILQETKNPSFISCRDGIFEQNMVVTDSRVKSFINAGRGTKPDSFVFRGNAWHRDGGGRKPSLPSREIDGIYDLDPKLAVSAEGEFEVTGDDERLQEVGPWHYTPWDEAADFEDVNIPPVRGL